MSLSRKVKTALDENRLLILGGGRRLYCRIRYFGRGSLSCDPATSRRSPRPTMRFVTTFQLRY
jgi:hypothetical protein